MVSMPRRYTPRIRSANAAKTRQRILDAALELLPYASDVSVERIAETASVSIQTIYTQFGSKRGLLIAAIDAAQRDSGAYVDFASVWSSPDGETALRRMVEATIRLWDRIWPLVAFTERARRSDDEIGKHLSEVDGYRRDNLLSIMNRLDAEGRIRKDQSAEWAADLVFALTTPSVYDELVRAASWPVDAAVSSVVDSVVLAVIAPGARSRLAEPADWSAVSLPPSMSP